MVSSTGCPFFALLFEDPSGCSRSQKNTILPSLYSLSLPPSLLPSPPPLPLSLPGPPEIPTRQNTPKYLD